jgi:hypothetical protein
MADDLAFAQESGFFKPSPRYASPKFNWAAIKACGEGQGLPPHRSRWPGGDLAQRGERMVPGQMQALTSERLGTKDVKERAPEFG